MNRIPGRRLKNLRARVKLGRLPSDTDSHVSVIAEAANTLAAHYKDQRKPRGNKRSRAECWAERAQLVGVVLEYYRFGRLESDRRCRTKREHAVYREACDLASTILRLIRRLHHEHAKPGRWPGLLELLEKAASHFGNGMVSPTVGEPRI